MPEFDRRLQGKSRQSTRGRGVSTVIETRQVNDIIRTTTNYNYGGSWQGAAYALGQVMSVTSNSHRNWANHTGSTTTYNYAWYQGAVQQSINHTQTGSSAGNTWMSYNLVAGQAVLQSASVAAETDPSADHADRILSHFQETALGGAAYSNAPEAVALRTATRSLFAPLPDEPDPAAGGAGSVAACRASGGDVTGTLQEILVIGRRLNITPALGTFAIDTLAIQAGGILLKLGSHVSPAARIAIQAIEMTSIALRGPMAIAAAIVGSKVDDALMSFVQNRFQGNGYGETSSISGASGALLFKAIATGGILAAGAVALRVARRAGYVVEAMPHTFGAFGTPLQIRKLTMQQRIDDAGLVGVTAVGDRGLSFAGSRTMFPATGTQRSSVSIRLTGSYTQDKANAFADAGISPSQSRGYSCHHVDYDASTGYGRMELVQSSAHSGFSHAGGASDYRRAHGGDAYRDWSW